MEIIELTSPLSAQQVADLLVLMPQLDPEISYTADMLQAAVADSSTHQFAAVEDGHIVGTASLCVSHSPTGRKGGIEDVVVGSAFRGRHIGRQLIEHIIAYARKNLAPIQLHLTSRPFRTNANRLYQAVGFRPYETNVYKLKIL